MNTTKVAAIDIAEYNKAGKEIPKSHKYKLKVNQKEYATDMESLTGREILQIAGKEPAESFLLNHVLHGGQSKPVGYDEKIDLTEPGIEKFTAFPKDPTDGGHETSI